jgi:hypothetical protein
VTVHFKDYNYKTILDARKKNIINILTDNYK